MFYLRLYVVLSANKVFWLITSIPRPHMDKMYVIRCDRFFYQGKTIVYLVYTEIFQLEHKNTI